jgi:hypothetical protein
MLKSDALMVAVQVVPRESRTAVASSAGERLRVAVTSTLVDGAANRSESLTEGDLVTPRLSAGITPSRGTGEGRR